MSGHHTNAGSAGGEALEFLPRFSSTILPASTKPIFEHMRFAFSFSMTLFAAGFAALVHALIPPLFETTASRLIKKMHARMEARH